MVVSLVAHRGWICNVFGGTTSSRLLSIVAVLLLFKIQATNADEVQSNSEHLDLNSKRQDLVPYPRVGRSTDGIQHFLLSLHEQAVSSKTGKSYEDRKPSPTKHQDKHNDADYPIPASEYMLPYMRPGRSESHDDDTNSNSDSDLDDGDYTRNDESAMTPNLRFGRADKQDFANILLYKIQQSKPFTKNGESSEDLQYLTPYPRIGKRDGYGDVMIPVPRFGRSSSNEYLKSIPDSQLREYMKSLLSGNTDFVTPYPRMGKRSRTKWIFRVGNNGKTDDGKKVNAGTPEITNSDLMLPYMRPGRSSTSEPIQTIVPYPRFGRSFEMWHPKLQGAEFNLLPMDFTSQWDRFTRSVTQDNDDLDLMLPQPRFGRSTNKLSNIGKSTTFTSPSTKQTRSIGTSSDGSTAADSSDNTTTEGTLIPYPRFGRSKRSIQYTPLSIFSKRSDGMKSFLGMNNSKSKAKDNKSKNNLEEQSYMLPYMRPGRSNWKENVSIAPYVQVKDKILNPQTEETADLYVIPYPRVGKS